MCYSPGANEPQTWHDRGGGMGQALSITWRSLKDLWEDFVLLSALNVLWSLTAVLPLFPIFLLGGSQPLLALGVAILLLAPLAIVSGGLCFVTNQITRGTAVGFGTFGIGVRRYWGKSLIVALINAIVLILVVANMQFYGFVLEGTWTNFALSLWVLMGGYWLLIQVFWFPMILESENEKVLLALRNALLMGLATPGFSLMLSIIVVLILVLSVPLTIPAMFFSASLLMLIANHATRSRIAFAQKKAYKPGPDEE